MDFQNIKKYYNLCDPYEPLEPDDERNLDVDAYLVRGINWVNKLVQQIELSNKPFFTLFTGHPGSGKTTELKRLAKQLSASDRANLFPVFIDAQDILDLSNPIDVTDIILAVLYSSIKFVAEKEENSVEKALTGGYVRRFWDWLCNTDIKIGQGDFAVPLIGELPFEMKTRPTLRQQIRNTVAPNFQHFIEEAKAELKTLNDRVKQNFNNNGMIIIFDSLEKLRGLTSNWYEVLESAEQVFGGNEQHIRLPVHVLYTVPAALATRRNLNVDFLPMIKVYDKNYNPYQPGIEAGFELIRKRIPDNILQEIFGSDRIDEQIRHLILSSGGYPREIIMMLQNVIIEKKYPVSDSALNRIIQHLANKYRMIILGEAFEWLAKVEKTKFLTIKNDEHRRIASLMLENHAVMQYLNDELWFALHPAVYQIPGVQEAINELEKQTAINIAG